ncbi:MAG: DUF4381 domain-containing protein [Thermodesulfobacteriota bacterium]|nr:DUF4381 domain-containing protein [Thermodesulfobacteriota bacterium]
MNIDLGPLYEPDAVRFSFETPGWYLLSLFLLFAAIFLFVRWLKRYRKNEYRREAMKTLTEIEQNSQHQNETNQLKDALVLLKIVAMKAFGRQEVAQLYGNEWLEFLESKGKDTPFTYYKQHIANTLYEPISVDPKEAKALIEISKQWISTHA